MNSITIDNITGLVPLLAKSNIQYEVLLDGWMVKMYYTNEYNLLEIGKLIGANITDSIKTKST